MLGPFLHLSAPPLLSSALLCSARALPIKASLLGCRVRTLITPLLLCSHQNLPPSPSIAPVHRYYPLDSIGCTIKDGSSSTLLQQQPIVYIITIWDGNRGPVSEIVGIYSL